MSSVVMIRFYVISKRLHLKCKELYDGRVVSMIKKQYGFVVYFL